MTETNPTHRHRATGSLVFPEGYKAAHIEPLSEGFWAHQELVVALAQLRIERDALLLDSDRLLLPDRGFSDEQRQQIFAYRAALKAMPEGDVLNPVWPPRPFAKQEN